MIQLQDDVPWDQLKLTKDRIAEAVRLTLDEPPNRWPYLASRMMADLEWHGGGTKLAAVNIITIMLYMLDEERDHVHNEGRPAVRAES